MTLDKATSGAFSLDLSTTDGSATTSDNDYSSLISQLVSFSGNPSENQTVSITLNDDLKVEDNETFTVVMSNLSGLQANISLSDTAQVTITDNDNATVTIDNVSAAENSGSAVATLRVDNPVQGGFWVSLLRADGSATLADSDYSAGIDNISFAGTAGETQTVSIPLVDDLKLEADETMLLTLGSASRPEIVISDNATVTITNDDTASLTIADVSVVESAGTATISVVLDNPVDGGFAVDVSSLDGTATTVDSDYTALSSPNQSFTGLAGETKTLSISLGGDTKLENDEQFSVQLSNLTNTTLPVVITDTATVTITNDDSATVTIADQTTAENSGPSVVTLSVDNAVQGGFSVDVSTSDGSATTADGDYTVVSSQTVNFTGTASETQTVSIPLGSDTKLEADETLTLSLGS
ncbi:MAG: hypothetical protein EBR97_02380, partial [Firmicutes bacterium]|nr:hypothetical protein [Bacillota bacterium]